MHTLFRSLIFHILLLYTSYYVLVLLFVSFKLSQVYFYIFQHLLFLSFLWIVTIYVFVQNVKSINLRLKSKVG